MKSKAYVGITGFKEISEVDTVSRQFMEKGFIPNTMYKNHTIQDYTVMFGFLCSSKRLADKGIPGKRSPQAEDLGMLAKRAPFGTIPMMHYYTNNRRNLAEEVKQLFSIDNMYSNSYCRALQINMGWPDIDQIKEIRKEFPEMQIVLQLPKSVLHDIERVNDYNAIVQYCLIDPSGGKGIGISDMYLELVSNLHESMPDTRLGIAGGLSWKNVSAVMKKVYSELQNNAGSCILDKSFCIDAEGKLRTADNKSLDFIETSRYIDAAYMAIVSMES